MNPDIFSQWLTRQGRKVIRSESSYWYDAGLRVLQAFPYHWLIEPSKKELDQLLINKAIVALRYSTKIDAPQGLLSYHVILKAPYEIEQLKPQARNGIRRGLSHCQVERISLERYANDGWRLQEDTLDRQGRIKSMTKKEWQRICLSAEGLSGFEAWGALCDGELAAALLIARIDDTYYVPYAQSLRQYLDLHINNALFYQVSRYMLSQKGIAGIFFSLQSLDAPESVNEFKFRMSFIPQPVRQRVVFHPFIRPWISSRLYSLVCYLKNRDQRNTKLPKIEGMLRFYIEGEKPIIQQTCPECLKAYQNQLLEKTQLYQQRLETEI
jgi:hypothetical protein